MGGRKKGRKEETTKEKHFSRFYPSATLNLSVVFPTVPRNFLILKKCHTAIKFDFFSLIYDIYC